MPSSTPPEEEWVAHTIRLPKTLNQRMLFQARRKFGGNVQAFLMNLVALSVQLPDAPDCNTCGFRRMGEAIIEELRKGH